MNFRGELCRTQRQRAIPAETEPHCLIIAEVAQAHDGSLGMAHAFIDAIASTKADAVKFQTHIAAAESTPDEPWRVKFSPQDKTRFDYWKRMEFTEDQWRGLREHAAHCGLLFISSPFSIEAVQLLTRVGTAAWKVASGEVSNSPLLDSMAMAKLPFIISTGMSAISEVDTAVERIESYRLPLAVLQCTSQYPCGPQSVGFNMLADFRERYRCPVGLSDHSGTIFPGIAGAALGMDVLEVHVTLSREMFGPDVASSVTTSELKQLVEGIRFVEHAMRHPIQKDSMAYQLSHMRSLFTKSLVARVDLQEGTVIQSEHLAVKKPGNGIPAMRLNEFLNARVKRNIPANTILREDDLER